MCVCVLSAVCRVPSGCLPKFLLDLDGLVPSLLLNALVVGDTIIDPSSDSILDNWTLKL